MESLRDLKEAFLYDLKNDLGVGEEYQPTPAGIESKRTPKQDLKTSELLFTMN